MVLWSGSTYNIIIFYWTEDTAQMLEEFVTNIGLKTLERTISREEGRMIPEKAVKMMPEITDDLSYSSTCDGREMVKDDRKGGRKEREVESEKKMIAGERRRHRRT